MMVALPGVRRIEHVMGMPVIVDVRDDAGDAVIDPVLDSLFAWLRFVDATFSTYKGDSEISRLNRGELALEDTHSDVRWVLERCEDLRVETDGYFDANADGSLDPSGLVKGWSIERAAGILEHAGLRNFALNAGGDIAVRGGALPEDDMWRVGIQHPLQRDKIAATVAISDGAIATSGEYERGQHVLDPHTRRPPEGVLSVTIVGPDLATADAYATAAFARGERAPYFTAHLRGYEAMTILADETVLFTVGFPRA
ncbi:MAG: FAD:protein FMN transferase [Gaiellaceae bacterium]